MRMPKIFVSFFSFPLLLICCLPAYAKKNKGPLPADALLAKTVYVAIDPDAGMSIDAPNANNIAQQNVEAAILKWGRFTLAPDSSSADLIITVRKGNGKVADGTIANIPGYGSPTTNMDDPEDPSQRNMQMGGPGGRQSPDGPQSPSPHIDAGPGEDTMAVYRGKRVDALDMPAVWQDTAKGALQSPNVPAVEAFRKLIAETEKQQAKNP